jgi:hypothetical protein
MNMIANEIRGGNYPWPNGEPGGVQRPVVRLAARPVESD